MITVFGSINMDLVATAARLPRPGETVPGNRFSTSAGGKGANQALAARRAGADVRMVGAVGNDQFADMAVALLDEAGVDLSGVAKVEEATGTALILVGADGENMITVVPGANGLLTPQDAERALRGMKAGDVLMLQLEIPAPAVERALKIAREHGVTTVLNLAPLVPEAARLAGLADVVIANETEFELLAGESIENAIERENTLKRLHAASGQTIVVTLGGDGAIAMQKGVFLRAASLPVKPVDTVGAGDTFCGYLAAGLDRGVALGDALGQACAAGALACLLPGAQPAIPVIADVLARVGER